MFAFRTWLVFIKLIHVLIVIVVNLFVSILHSHHVFLVFNLDQSFLELLAILSNLHLSLIIICYVSIFSPKNYVLILENVKLFWEVLLRIIHG